MNRQKIIILFYDISMVEKEQKREYRTFKKELKKLGFIPIQESVYIKLLSSGETRKSILDKVTEKVPHKSSVMALELPIRVFRKIKELSGEKLNMSWLIDDIVFI